MEPVAYQKRQCNALLRDMGRYKPNQAFRNWVESKSVVAIGYYDEVKQINLDYLLANWIDITQEYKESFSDHYPYAGDHLEIKIVEKDDPRLEEPGIMFKVLEDFRHCHHIKVWSDGEPMDEEVVREIIETIKKQTKQLIKGIVRDICSGQF